MERVIKKRMVIDFVQMNGQTNLREAASVAGVSKTTAHRFLKEEGFKAYKFSNHQELKPQDFIARYEMCRWFRKNIETTKTTRNYRL